MEKKVKRFGMDISPTHGLQWNGHTFTSSSFSSSLLSLELSGANVSGKVLETFLHNCPLLEFLSVRDSDSLVNLRVVEVNLKYLIIYHCFKMKHVEVSAPNLVYVNYFGPIVSVPFKNNPKLSEICVGGQYGIDMTNNFMEHTSYLSRLEALTLLLPCQVVTAIQSVKFPGWTRLKKLVVRIDTWNLNNFSCMKSIIDACPFLNKFVLQLESNGNVVFNKAMLYCRRWKVICAYNHFKNVEILGLDGSPRFCFTKEDYD